jgi:hypothetical protein
MRTIVLCGIFLCTIAAKAQQPVTGISGTFRAAAEETLDCLDGASVVEQDPEVVFEPQSLGCRAMLRKLGRSARTPQESIVVADLGELQTKIVSCHLAHGESCDDAERLIRTKAIKDGGLRVPDAAGKP